MDRANTYDWRGVIGSVLAASPLLVVVTMIVTFGSTLSKSIRWWFILRQSTRVEYRTAFRLTTAAAGMNAFLTANAGDIMRARNGSTRARSSAGHHCFTRVRQSSGSSGFRHACGGYHCDHSRIGVALPITVTMGAAVAVNLGGVLRATPGNDGVFQGMYALALAPFGVDAHGAVAAAVLIQSAQLLSGARAATTPHSV